MLDYYSSFSDELVKIAIKDQHDHFKEQMSKGRGGYSAAQRKAVVTDMETLVRRMNARPEMIERVGADGKRYKSNAGRVRSLPNAIGVKLPTGGIAVLQNRQPDSLRPQYTINTMLDDGMRLFPNTEPMSLKSLYKRLVPEAFPKKPPKVTDAMLVKNLQKQYGFSGPGSKQRWSNALSEVSKAKKTANETRAMLGNKTIGEGDKVRSIKPGPRPNVPHLSTNRTRKLTRAVLALASKGKLKLSSVLSSRRYLREVLARSLRQGASSSLG